MDFDDLELHILRNPAQSLQLLSAIKNSEEKLLFVLSSSLAIFLKTHLGDTCHAEAQTAGISLFRKDLLINHTELDEETQEVIYSNSDSNFAFSISLHPDVTAWSLLEKKRLKGASDVVISFEARTQDDPDSSLDLVEVIERIDTILLPTTYKKRKTYGGIRYVLQKKIYISSETLLDDLVEGHMGKYFDSILSALSGFHRIPWDKLKVISEKMEWETKKLEEQSWPRPGKTESIE